MDLDGDGQLDLLSGSWPGELYFFKGKGKGQFAEGVTLADRDGKAIKLGSASTAFAADWNGDGLLDLLVGCIEGSVFTVPNEGSAEKPLWGKAQKLEADGKPIQVAHGDSHPVAADWDGDGKVDLVAGTGAGSVLWYRNTGSNKEPKLAAAVTLVPESRAAKGDDREKHEGWGMRAKVGVVDWNGDGRLDLLVGDFSYRMTEAPKLTDEQKAEQAKAREKYNAVVKKYAPLIEEQRQLQRPPANETEEDRSERARKLKEVTQKVQELQKEVGEAAEGFQRFQARPEYQGNVWLFLRKPSKEAAGSP